MDQVDCPVLENQTVAVKDSKITFIGKKGSYSGRAKKTIEAKNKILMPGLINGHCHMAMTLFRGIGDDQNLNDWLHNVIFPLEAKHVHEDFIKIGVNLALAESIKSGVCTLLDMYFYTELSAQLVDHAGLRALIGEGVCNFPTPGNRDYDGSDFKRLSENIESYKEHDRITPCIAPHAPYTCSDDLLKKCADFARKNSIPLSIHLAETKTELEGQLKEHKKSPTRRLYDLSIMDTSKTIFAHAIHVDDKDIALIKKSASSVVHNPESNMKLGSGIMPFSKYLDAGVDVGLGTDGAASNNNLNLFGEMSTAAKLQKLNAKEPGNIGAKEMLYAATLGGAKALGLGDSTGSIELGKKADLILLNTRTPNFYPLTDLRSQLVYASTGDEVDTVICNGKILMEKRELKTIDEDKILDEAQDFYDKNLKT